MKLKESQLSVGWLIVLAGLTIIVVVVGLGINNIVTRTYGLTSGAENSIVLNMIVAVSVLLLLLFIMTTAFSRLGLNDRQQALGLPEGSVRALIALILIVMFVLLGVYLFRSVAGTPTSTALKGLSLADVSTLGARVYDVQSSTTISGTVIADSYDVTLRRDVPEDSTRLAQQLLTTIATLVVAVSGFYFGTSAVKAASKVTQETTGEAAEILTVSPDNGKVGQQIDPFTIRGVNLDSACAVRLQRGASKIQATDITTAATRIRCNLKLNLPQGETAGGEKWDVVVATDVGEYSQAKAFTITA
ncbi:MAG: hypothetical protein WCF84_04515 [Anaerolineae bacterium]